MLAVDLIAVLAFAIAVFIASSAPTIVPLALGGIRFDKLVHFGAFAVFAVLLCRFFYRLTGSVFWAVWLGVVLGSLYGVSDEIHQSFVPGRFDDIYDLFADILGAIAGAFAWLFYIQRR